VCAGLASVLLATTVAQVAAAGPTPEVLREEQFNYRIIGVLPRGWKRTPDKLVYTYAVDGIPLAYVHFVRERVSGTIDVEAELKRRAIHYRFPGAPKQPTEKYTAIRWSDRDAVSYEHELTIAGVACKRIVRAMVDNGVWYECIETLHGEPGPRVLAGLACFRGGFLLLTRPVAKSALGSTVARRINDAVYGYRIEKPEGYLLQHANPGADPGCRLAILRAGPDAGQQLSIRLFEYGVRKKYNPAAWLDLLEQSFRRSHVKARREKCEAPIIDGAQHGDGMLLFGSRDDRKVETTIYLWQAQSGRVFGLRIVSHSGAAKTHAASLSKLIGSLVFTGQER